MKDVTVKALVHVGTEKSSYLFGMTERIANAARAAREISRTGNRKWVEQLNHSADKGNFFSSINYSICVGVRDW